MLFFKYFTPITYWLLFLMWSFIFLFYVNRLISKKANDKLILTLLTILSIDAFRTLFESAYFGAWYTSLVGFLPKTVHAYLVRPEIVFIPKALNVIAAVVVIVILIYRWIPQEEHEKDRMKILRDAFAKLNGDKTYKKLMQRIGENIEYMDGPDYDKLRPVNQGAYRELVKKISGQ